jgi:hypothetical protein
MPCGGCHVASLGDLEEVRIRKMKLKKGVLRISYELDQLVTQREFPDGIDCIPMGVPLHGLGRRRAESN